MEDNLDPINMVDREWLKAYISTASIIAEMHNIAFKALVASMGEDDARLLAPRLLPSIVESAEQEAVRIHKEALALAAREREQQELEEELRRREEALQQSNSEASQPW